MKSCLSGLIVVAALAAGQAQHDPHEIAPVEHVYASPNGVDLKLFVFSPASKTRARRAAVVIFHGGGWTMGSPEWAFPKARHFAKQGLVAVAAQYRLSDRELVTPVEAMADARAAMRWTRSKAAELQIDPNRIAGYGWSAGGHLVASAAIFDDSPGTTTVGCAPNALVLVSPAVDITRDDWLRRALLGRTSPGDISPAEHVRPGLPPTLILQGRTDTVTPLTGVQKFCDRMREAGNRCELKIYEGVGHLFTPSGEPDDGWPNPDPEVRSAVAAEVDRFLALLGYMGSVPD